MPITGVHFLKLNLGEIRAHRLVMLPFLLSLINLTLAFMLLPIIWVITKKLSPFVGLTIKLLMFFMGMELL